MPGWWEKLGPFFIKLLNHKKILKINLLLTPGHGRSSCSTGPVLSAPALFHGIPASSSLSSLITLSWFSLSAPSKEKGFLPLQVVVDVAG